MAEEEKKDDELSIDFGKITKFFKGDKKDEKESSTSEAGSSDEVNIDLESIAAFIKKHKTIFVYSVLIILLLMTFYSRIQSIPNLQNEFNETAYLISPDDPYAFLRYSNYIADDKLPANDTLRYYPDGVDITSENLGSAYVAGYMLKFARVFNPDATMYDVAAYFAPLLLVIGIAAFFFLTKEILGDDLTALTASGLLAFSIAIFFRTAAGFLEKEPLFLPLMILSFLFFLRAYKQKDMNKWMYINGILGGVFAGLAGTSSGLFFFIEIYLAVFVIIEVLLQKMNKQKLVTYTIWLVVMSLVLLVSTTKYGTPISFLSELHFQVPAVALPFMFLAVFLKQPKQIAWIPKGLFHVLVGLGAILLIGAAISVFTPGFLTEKIGWVFERIQVPIGVNRFAQSVSENQPPTFLGGGSSWWTTFGVSFMSPTGGYFSIGLIFLMFFFGGIIMFYKEFKNFRYAKYLTAIFGIFMCALIFENFSGEEKYMWVDALFGNQFLFFALFGITALAFLFLEHRSHEHLEKINSTYLLILTWFLVATIAANGSVRLFFMLAFPAMIMATYFIRWSSEFLSEKINTKLWTLPYIFGAVIIVMMFSVITISNASMYPGLETYYDSLNWVKDNTPQDAVFTHWWDYGYIVQTIGERATVVDPGNFYPVRDYNTGGYLFNAFNNSESLMYLNTYNKPDYWFIISEDIPKFYQISRLGSLSNLTGNLEGNETLGRESYFATYALMSQETGVKPNNLGVYTEYPMMIIMEPLAGPTQVLQDFRVGNTIYPGDSTFILRIIVPASNNETGPVLAQVYNQMTQKMEVLKVQCTCEKKVGCSDVNNTENMTLVPTCVLPFDGGALNIPYKTKDVLFTQLYVLERKIPGYELVYNSTAPLDLLAVAGRTTNIMIYKFNYTAIEENEGW